jgi:hypothetical protein
MTAQEIPDIAGAEIDDLGLSLRIDGGDAAVSADHVGSFGGIGVPMQLAQSAGIERYLNPGKLVGDRELGDGYLLGSAAVADLRLGVVEGSAERGKLRDLRFHP